MLRSHPHFSRLCRVNLDESRRRRREGRIASRAPRAPRVRRVRPVISTMSMVRTAPIDPPTRVVNPPDACSARFSIRCEIFVRNLLPAMAQSSLALYLHHRSNGLVSLIWIYRASRASRRPCSRRPGSPSRRHRSCRAAQRRLHTADARDPWRRWRPWED